MIAQLLAAAKQGWEMYSEMMKANPFMASALTLYVTGLFTYVFRTVPGRIWSYWVNQFTVSVAIHNNDNLFQCVTDWLEEGGKVFRCKNFAAKILYGTKQNAVTISIGYGNHIFFHKRRIFYLSRVEKEVNNTTDRKESLFVSTYGWSPNSIREFLQDVVPQPEKDGDTAICFFSDSYWYKTTHKPKRDLSTVILTDENEKRLKEHIHQYMKGKEWYKKHRIPWRTGIILEGPPGTGKSTLSLALCGEFDCNLYIANLNLMGEDKLMAMFKSLPPKSIMLVEDIDAYQIAKTREKSGKDKAVKGAKGKATISKDVAATPDNNPLDGVMDMLGGANLSGLLNAIDGICSTEDRILIATTNHLEKLDPALIRPGRFELILKIDNLNDETARKMFKKFYPEFKLPDNFKMKENVSPVTFQTEAIGSKNNPQKLLEMYNENYAGIKVGKPKYEEDAKA